MKFRITPGAPELHQNYTSIVQSNSDFVNKIEANDLILPPTSHVNVVKLIFFVFQSVNFIPIETETYKNVSF